MESPYFPVTLREVPANIQIEELKDLSFAIGTIRVQSWFANHPGICVGYRLFTPGGSIVFFPDNESRAGHRHTPNREVATPEAKAFAEQEEDKLRAFLLQADVLIMDAQYSSEEYRNHIGWGHGCVDDVVALAISAQVKRLFLFHHDPDHDDAAIDQLVARARKIVSERKANLVVEAAAEGSTIQLPE
jgi:phosphoribosyl 1,2-cyclic phosphodiesterase